MTCIHLCWSHKRTAWVYHRTYNYGYPAKARRRQSLHPQWSTTCCTHMTETFVSWFLSWACRWNCPGLQHRWYSRHHQIQSTATNSRPSSAPSSCCRCLWRRRSNSKWQLVHCTTCTTIARSNLCSFCRRVLGRCSTSLCRLQVCTSGWDYKRHRRRPGHIRSGTSYSLSRGVTKALLSKKFRGLRSDMSMNFRLRILRSMSSLIWPSRLVWQW